MTPAEISAHVALIEELMAEVMKETKPAINTFLPPAGDVRRIIAVQAAGVSATSGIARVKLIRPTGGVLMDCPLNGFGGYMTYRSPPGCEIMIIKGFADVTLEMDGDVDVSIVTSDIEGNYVSRDWSCRYHNGKQLVNL